MTMKTIFKEQIGKLDIVTTEAGSQFCVRAVRRKEMVGLADGGAAGAERSTAESIVAMEGLVRAVTVNSSDDLTPYFDGSEERNQHFDHLPMTTMADIVQMSMRLAGMDKESVGDLQKK